MGIGLELLPATLHGEKKIMVNCLIWKIAVLALILAAAARDSGASVIVSEVESESQGNGESPVPSTDKMDQFNHYSTRNRFTAVLSLFYRCFITVSILLVFKICKTLFPFYFLLFRCYY